MDGKHSFPKSLSNDRNSDSVLNLNNDASLQKLQTAHSVSEHLQLVVLLIKRATLC